MDNKLEKKIQAEILEYLRGNHRKSKQGIGGWWINNHGGDPYMPRGIPDITGCYHGKFAAIEVKRPGETPTTIQKKTMGEIEAAGGKVIVAYSLDDVVKMISEL